jgi:IS30 family transposase
MMGKRYQHLCYEERVLIQTQLGLRMSPTAIAASLGRSPTTVLRELRRNGWKPVPPVQPCGRPSIAGRYHAVWAENHARRQQSKPPVARQLRPGSALWDRVLTHLGQGLSPMQIKRTLALMPDPVRLSHETIYTSLYAMPRGELRTRVLNLLRHGHKARRSRKTAKDRRNQAIPNMTLIDQRPIEVAMRLIPGHWEGDLIIGKRNQSQVGTLVERTTLFVALVKLDNAKAATTAEAFTKILNRFDHHLRRSMTYDQGTEMAHHQTLTEKTGVDVYFAHPHAPWERGISENTNGLIRQYLPRGTDLSVFSQEQLDEIAWKLNVRIRKSLGWKCPNELFLPEGTFNFVLYWSQFSNKLSNVALQP